MQNHISSNKSGLNKRTYAFAVDIIKFIQNHPDDLIFREIKRQLLRSASSIVASIVTLKKRKNSLVPGFNFAFLALNYDF
jgi:hypothetical protein